MISVERVARSPLRLLNGNLRFAACGVWFSRRVSRARRLPGRSATRAEGAGAEGSVARQHHQSRSASSLAIWPALAVFFLALK
jgi:hypothetical protein